MEQADKEKKAKLQKRRMELAALGARAMKTRNFAEAVPCFLGYLKILEQSKGAPPGKLVPAHFDRKAELSELVLIAGIYWDLVKVYDRSKSASSYRELNAFLDKFLLFSKGMPYEPVCRELIRKYLRNDKPIHAKEFREAYRKMTGNKCFVATSLVDQIDERTLPRLRKFRDRRLQRRWAGRVFVRFYYAIGPAFADAVDRFPNFIRARLGRGLDLLAARLMPALFLVLFLPSGAPHADDNPELAQLVEQRVQLQKECGEGKKLSCGRLGGLEFLEKRFADAVPNLTLGCEASDKFACNGLAMSLSQIGKHEQAIPRLRPMCEAQDYPACMALGVSLAASKKSAEAIRVLTPTCKQIPGGRCESLLSKLLSSEGQPSAALEMITVACNKGDRLSSRSVPQAGRGAGLDPGADAGIKDIADLPEGPRLRELKKRFEAGAIDQTCPKEKGQSHLACFIRELNSITRNEDFSTAAYVVVGSIGSAVMKRDLASTESLVSRKVLKPRFIHGHLLDAAELSLILMDRVLTNAPGEDDRQLREDFLAKSTGLAAGRIEELEVLFKADATSFNFDEDRLGKLRKRFNEIRRRIPAAKAPAPAPSAGAK